MSTPSLVETIATRALYALWGLFWVAMIAVSMQNEWQNPYIRWWEPLLWEGSSALVATVWLLTRNRADSRYQQYLDRPGLWFAHHLKWFPLLAVTFIVSIYVIRHGVYALVGREYHHESWTFVFVYETVKLLMFVNLWLGVIFSFHAFARWRSQRERLLELQRSLAESQLRQLQSQLRPHFLFNALNTISALMHSAPERADRLLARLGDLLRISLQTEHREQIALREELQVLELYAQIMQERFSDRVELSWDVDARALSVSVPTLLLQPLLENAFKHGVEKSQGPVMIQVQARRENDALVFVVCNTGELSVASEPGIGLRNSRERLRLMYGRAAALTLTQQGADVIAQLTLPWQEA